MPEHPRKPTRSGAYRSGPEPGGSPREPAYTSQDPSSRPSLFPVESSPTSTAERAREPENLDAIDLSRTIRELIQGQAGRAASPANDGEPRPTEGIAGLAMLSFEDASGPDSTLRVDEPLPTVEPAGPVSERPPLDVRAEPTFADTPDRDPPRDVPAIAPTVADVAPGDIAGLVSPGRTAEDGRLDLAPQFAGDPDAATPAEVPPAPKESVVALIAGLAGAGGTNLGEPSGRSDLGSARESGGLTEGKPLATPVVLDVSPGGWVAAAARDTSATEGAGGPGTDAGIAPDATHVPASGLLEQHQDTFDSPFPSGVSQTAGGRTDGGDPFQGQGVPGADAQEGRSGADMSRTNALLEQILDELRRHGQPAYVESGRSVYPER